MKLFKIYFYRIKSCNINFSVLTENLEMTDQQLQDQEKLREVRAEFVNRWGVMGTQWGINRTMAQVHAMLMVTPDALNTDQVMEELGISRGNAHTSLKDLVGWGLLRIITKKGDRKEYFEAEKDVWKIFQAVTRERMRREIDPALQVLQTCEEETASLKGREAEAFNKQMKDLAEFVSLTSSMGLKAAAMSQSKAMQMALRIMS